MQDLTIHPATGRVEDALTSGSLRTHRCVEDQGSKHCTRQRTLCKALALAAGLAAKRRRRERIFRTKPPHSGSYSNPADGLVADPDLKHDSFLIEPAFDAAQERIRRPKMDQTLTIRPSTRSQELLQVEGQWGFQHRPQTWSGYAAPASRARRSVCSTISDVQGIASLLRAAAYSC